MKIINFKNVHVSYKVKPVLEKINLTINEGENWAILGANGSGKSTLIKVISSDLYPNTKYPFTKEILGKDRWSVNDLKKRLGIITNDLHNHFSNRGFFLTAYEVVLSGYYSSLGVFKHQDFTKEQHDRVLEVMEFLKLVDIRYKKVNHMSTGELRKCIIARALIHKPKAFILDEPTVGLDIKAQIDFIKIMQELSKNSSIILITHHIEEIFPEISNIALMYQSTIYKQGLKKDILNSKNLSEVFQSNLSLKQTNDRYYFDSASSI